jgi:hypothetical protein
MYPLRVKDVHIAPSNPLLLTSSLTRCSSHAPQVVHFSTPFLTTSISSPGESATPPVLERRLSSAEEACWDDEVEERERERREGERRSSERDGSRIGGSLFLR